MKENPLQAVCSQSIICTVIWDFQTNGMIHNPHEYLSFRVIIKTDNASKNKITENTQQVQWSFGSENQI